MKDPFKGLTVRQTAALAFAKEYRKAELVARRNYEAKHAQAIMAVQVARKEGVGIKRLAQVMGVSGARISDLTRSEKVVLPTRQRYSQNGEASSPDDPALEGVGAIQREEHLDQLPTGEVDVPRGVFLPPDSDP